LIAPMSRPDPDDDRAYVEAMARRDRTLAVLVTEREGTRRHVSTGSLDEACD